MTDVITPAPCPKWSRQVPHGGHPWESLVDGPVECPGWPPAYTEPPATLAEPSTAAVRDGRPLVHSHVGQQQPHVHTAETLRDHRRPIVGERVYSRLPEPGSAPATVHDGPYEAASALRRWADLVADADSYGRLPDWQGLARDLRGAALLLDGM